VPVSFSVRRILGLRCTFAEMIFDATSRIHLVER